jgi:acetamidase/formamidase
MDVTLIVELVKASAGPAPLWPRLENDDEIIVIGSSRPLEDAWRISQVEMVSWLGELLGLDRLDAYQLLTQVSLAPLANVVDTNYSAVTKVSKALVPGLRPHDGLHADLRSRAASLT